MARASFGTGGGSSQPPVISGPFIGTPEQNAIHAELLNGTRNVVVSAVAGSGKTACLVEYCKLEPRAMRLAFVAFNKHIATELASRLAGTGQPVDCMTYHSLGLKILRRTFRKVDVNQWKVYDILDAMTLPVADGQEKIAKSRIKQLVSLAKSYGVRDRASLERLVDHHDLDLNGMEEMVLEYAPRVLDKCKARTGVVDFDDMVWLPGELGLHTTLYDLMLVDECFIGDTPIMLDYRRSMKIRDMVEQRYSGAVASYKNGETVFQRVTGWHKIPVRGNMLRIKTRRIGLKTDGTRQSDQCNYVQFGNRTVICTEDHRFYANGTWVAARDLKVGTKLVQESHAPKDPTYQDKYKHGRSGLKNLSRLMTKKNKDGVCGTSPDKGVIHEKHRGGNGRLSPHEEALHLRLGDSWINGLAVPTRRANGLPYNVKIDLANPIDKIAIELDGHSHKAKSRKEQDRRKDAFLRKVGWTVIRLTNQEAMALSDEALQSLTANSPVDAEVIEIERWVPKEPFVYDITVDETHCYYANGVLAHNCQDTSPVQQTMAVGSSDRLCFVGDRNQAIYGFRGADSRALDNITAALGTTSRGVVELPLTLTRRCPKSHVRLAQTIVPQITAMDDAPEGVVRYMSRVDAVNEMRPGDLVLCRVNADLLMVAYQLLKLGIKAVVKGRDIGAGIVKLVEEAEDGAASLTIPELISAAGEITDTLVGKFLAIPNGRGEMRASAATDRYECLVRLCDGVQRRGKSAGGSTEVKAAIAALFADEDENGNKKDCVTLGSIHRTKGLEASRVYVLRPDLLPHPMAKQPHEKIQELNCIYISITRSKFDVAGDGELIFIDGECSLFGPIEQPVDLSVDTAVQL